MKKTLEIICLLLCLSVISCYDGDIESINSRLDAIENNQIASLKEQIESINQTLPELENADKELKEYISRLQAAETALQEQIATIENELLAQLGKSQTEILAQLEVAKDELNKELEYIKTTIATLQEKDKALEQRIAELKDYVDEEIKNMSDWTKATFATLEQYDWLVTEIAAIKENINGIDNSLVALETKFEESIKSAIEKALEEVDADIKTMVDEIVASYTKAIDDAKTDITVAYTKAISEAISDVETSMKGWVNEQLAGYYTIAEVEAKLTILSETCATKDNLHTEIEKLLARHIEIKVEITEAYTKSIEEAIGTYEGVIDQKIAEAISTVNLNVNKEIETIKAKISAIEERLNTIEASIATISEQMENINATLEELRNADTQLDEYIKNLQSTAKGLQTAITETNEKIDAVEEALREDVSVAKSEVLAELAELKSEMEGELAQITQTITALQAKDAELEGRINELQGYVQNELANTKDWAEATFATLEQYNALADEVTGIKVQIESLVSSIAQLETRINDKISTEITQVMTVLDETTKETVKEITDAYTAAISTAKDEITSAYTEAIETAIFTIEISMQTWVNEQLSNYYTMAQVDAMLGAMELEFAAQLEAQKNYLIGLIDQLSEDLNNQIACNKNLIDALRTDVNSIFDKDASQAELIATNATTIAKNAADIIANAQEIAANSDKIAENDAKIAENNKLIEANVKLIADNQSAIAALSASTDAAVAELLEKINDNAKAIVDNAALIGKNATAINNNAEAIAQNAADIQQLRQDLAETKEEITEAYQAAIQVAIETLDGALRDEISTQVATINTRIDNEMATINTALEALATRITNLEKEVKTIKVVIYNMQSEIAEMQEQIAAIIGRIQSVTFVPEYADGKATMYYTNSSGMITAGKASLRYEVRPASSADELAEVWDEALSVKAVYTKTRAVGDFVSLDIESATAEEGILSIVASGSNLSEEFFRSEMQANICLEISNGYNCLTSDYTHMVPWTTNVVNISDANFKSYLVGEYDTNSDGEISLDEAEVITQIDIAASLLQVKSMAGIEYFTNLESLNCSYNRITTLDLTNNSKLARVNVSHNKLTSLSLPASVVTVDASANQLITLDVSAAKELTSFNVSDNKLASLNVEQNKVLKSLDCGGNQLAALDVTRQPSLTTLSCGENNISALNLAKNTLLTSLDCNSNSLMMLDLTKNVVLTTLDCGENALTALHIGSHQLTSLACNNNRLTNLNVSMQDDLTTLDCSHNLLTLLDVAKCSRLATLDCSYNALASLNISCNTALETIDCSDNSNLAKLWVKNEAQTNSTAITKEDATNIYYNNGGLNIPDAALKAYLVNNYDDDGDGEISIAESDNITMVNCSNKGISDLTGLESCSNLVTLNCANNSITTIALPNLIKLTTLTCNGNPIERIDLDNCASLKFLNLQGTPSSAISGSGITITNYTQAETLYFSAKSTPFTSFIVENTPTLTALEFYGEFTDVVVTDNILLSSLDFYSPVVNATISGNSVLENIDVSVMYDLQTLDVRKCNLQSLDVTQNLALASLNCSGNAFTSLDLSKNTQLETLVGDDLALTKMNLSNNTLLANYSFTNNPDLTSIRVCNDFTMDNCLFTSIGNNPSLTIFNTAGDVFYYVGQYSTNFGSAGIVYEITNGGQNGKMVSTTQEADRELLWSTESIVTNARDENDGMANMNVIKSINPDLSRYPAFKWCADYGTNWYLPAINELITIYNTKEIINLCLSAGGFTTLDRDYISSVEYYAWDFMFLHFNNGDIWDDTKNADNYHTKGVRAVLSF